MRLHSPNFGSDFHALRTIVAKTHPGSNRLVGREKMGQNHAAATTHRPLNKRERVFYGGLGAIVPIVVELLAINYREMFVKASSFADIISYVSPGILVGYALQSAILFAAGGAYVFFIHAKENNPSKLFQLGIITPALLSSLGGNIGATDTSTISAVGRTESIFIATAYAQETKSPKAASREGGFTEEFLKGFSLLRGLVSPQRKLSVENTSTYLQDYKVNNRNWWDWTIFIKGPEEELKKVKCVEYELHPTFKPPVETICQREPGVQAFRLTQRGWGTFNVKVRIKFKDGSQLQLEHLLKFAVPRLN